MNIEDQLQSKGEGVVIYPTARIIRPNNLSMGEYSKIDDFCFIYAAEPSKIGRYVHIATGVSIIGGGGFEIGDYACIAAGGRLVTSTNEIDEYHGSASTPRETQRVTAKKIILERDAFIGTNAIVMPGVRIREGAVLGAGALATKDLEAWGVYIGVPAKLVRYRKPVRKEFLI